jgi:eukaryotic translation initiation factor 2C
LFEYDVSISPVAGTAMRRVRRRIFQLAEQTSDWAKAGLRGIVAHDHSSKLIAAKKLPQPITVVVPFYDEHEDPGKGGKEYTLNIKYNQDIETQSLLKYVHIKLPCFVLNLIHLSTSHLVGQPQYRGYDPLPVISALNIILAAHPSRAGADGGVMVGRNKFFFPSPSAPPVSLGGGLEAWKGFYSSVRVAHKQLMVNVNVCTTAFYTPGNLAEAMISFLNASHGARISAFVKGVRVKATHLGYRKTVKNIAKATPGQHRFDCAELGGTVTVEEYFKRSS